MQGSEADYSKKGDDSQTYEDKEIQVSEAGD